MTFRDLYLVISLWLAGFLICLPQSASGQTLLHTIKMSDSQAENAGFKRQKFSFQISSIDFETFVPANAQVSTMPYRVEPIEQGQIGRVLPIGQMNFLKDNTRFETVIFSYRLRTPPAALKTCTWQMSSEGYRILHTYAPHELIEAQIFGIQLDEQNKPQKATLAYCYARGDTLIANYFTAALPGDEKQAETAVTTLRETVASFVNNMQFANGQPNGLDDTQIEKKTLMVDNSAMNLFFPKRLDVVIDNSEKNILPYEIHLIQKLQSGKMFSHLFLWINTATEPVTEEALRKQAEIFTNIYIASQIKSDTAESGIYHEFVSSNSIPGYAKSGITARAYRYKIIEKEKPDAATTFYVTIIRTQNKLYALYYHSLRTDNKSASEYFTGTAGDVAYDMMRNSIYEFLLAGQ